MNRQFLILWIIPSALFTFLQAGLTDFKTIEAAKEAYEAKAYTKSAALLNALESKTPQKEYDIGNAYYKSKNYDAAIKSYRQADGVDKAMRLHNIGNAYFQKKDLESAIKSYEEALQIREDEETRFNLELAKKMKKEQEKKKQEQKKKEQKKKEQDKKEDQDKKDYQQFIGNADLNSLRWADVIHSIKEANPDCPITVWCNEDTPIIWPTILREITGLDPQTRLHGELDIIRNIMSEGSVDLLIKYLDERPALTEIQRRRIRAIFLEKFALEDEIEEEIDLPGWTEETINMLSENYDEDIEEIERISGVNLISL